MGWHFKFFQLTSTYNINAEIDLPISLIPSSVNKAESTIYLHAFLLKHDFRCSNSLFNTERGSASLNRSRTLPTARLTSVVQKVGECRACVLSSHGAAATLQSVGLWCPPSDGRRGLGARRGARSRRLGLRNTQVSPPFRQRLVPWVRKGRRQGLGRRRRSRRAPHRQGLSLKKHYKTIQPLVCIVMRTVLIFIIRKGKHLFWSFWVCDYSLFRTFNSRTKHLVICFMNSRLNKPSLGG